MENQVKQRIIDFIEHEGITKAAFTNSIGVSKSYINNISKSIGIENICTIKFTYPKLNIEWLLTGVGEMIHEENQPKSIVLDNNYNELLAHIRWLEELVDDLRGKQRKEKTA